MALDTDFFSNLALFNQGRRKAESDFAKASAAKDKLEADKERNKLDFDIKKLQIQKAEFGLSPEQQAFATKKAKLEMDFTRSQIDANIGKASEAKSTAALIDQELTQAGNELVQQSQIVLTPEQEKLRSESFGRAQQDILLQQQKGVTTSTSRRFGPITKRRTIQPLPVPALPSRELVDRMISRLSEEKFGKLASEITVAQRDELRAEIESNLGVAEGTFKQPQAQQVAQPQQQLGTAEQEIDLNAPNIREAVAGLRKQGISDKEIREKIIAARG